MSTAGTVRPALPTDVAAVREVVRNAFAPHIPRLGREPRSMNADFAQLIATGEMHVLENAGQIVGVIRLRAEPPALWVENVAVDPGFQHQGYGRQLLAFAEQQARAAGLSELRLYANELMLENIALYARLGYVETERQLHGDFHRVFMRKPLA